MAQSKATDEPGTQRAFRRSEKLGNTKLSICISKRASKNFLTYLYPSYSGGNSSSVSGGARTIPLKEHPRSSS